MKRLRLYFLSILYFFIAILTITNNPAVSQTRGTLIYKPFKRAIYHLSVSKELRGSSIGNIESPLIINLDKERMDGTFVLRMFYVSPGSGDHPNRDFVLSGEMEYRSSGLIGLLNSDHKESTQKERIYLFAPSFAKGSFFPIFPNNKSELRLGKSWKIEGVPVAYFFGPYGPIELKSTKSIISFEWVENTKVDYFTCARITYSIDDEYIPKDSEPYKFKCSGTVYFAIKEGIVVSDFVTVEQDCLFDKKRKKIKGYRKYRLVHYEPVDSN